MVGKLRKRRFWVYLGRGVPGADMKLTELKAAMPENINLERTFNPLLTSLLSRTRPETFIDMWLTFLSYCEIHPNTCRAVNERDSILTN